MVFVDVVEPVSPGFNVCPDYLPYKDDWVRWGNREAQVKEAYSNTYRSYRLPNYERNCFEMTNVVKLAVWSDWVTGVLRKHFGKMLFDAVLRLLQTWLFLIVNAHDISKS